MIVVDVHDTCMGQPATLSTPHTRHTVHDPSQGTQCGVSVTSQQSSRKGRACTASANLAHSPAAVAHPEATGILWYRWGDAHRSPALVLFCSPRNGCIRKEQNRAAADGLRGEACQEAQARMKAHPGPAVLAVKTMGRILTAQDRLSLLRVCSLRFVPRPPTALT